MSSRKQVMDFCCKIYCEIINDQTTNTFCSPLSIAVALAMTSGGAKGNSLTQIIETLGLESDDLHSEQKRILDLINGLKSVDMLNAIIIRKNYKVIQEFIQLLETYYGTSIKTVETANSWINELSRGKIKQLLSKMYEDFALVIINVIIFEAKWLYQFEEYRTKTSNFFVTKDIVKNVRMMCQFENFLIAYNEYADCDILQLPYEDETTSMLIFLPRAIDGLQLIEKSFNGHFLKKCITKLEMHNVDVELPIFKIENNLGLRPVLEKMGIKDIFSSGSADLRGINNSGELYVHDVKQRSYLTVNEQGSEAGAITEMMCFDGIGSYVKAKSFKANHPFMFCIFNKASQLILFMGCLRDPSS